MKVLLKLVADRAELALQSMRRTMMILHRPLARGKVRCKVEEA
jgi:hypothetical protein